jgi:hypothetical protein
MDMSEKFFSRIRISSARLRSVMSSTIACQPAPPLTVMGVRESRAL